MSGGHFDYIQYQIEDAATEIRDIVKRNNVPDDNLYSTNFSEDTIARFNITATTLEKAAAMLHHVDLLVSDDCGEESFNKRWDIESTRKGFDND